MFSILENVQLEINYLQKVIALHVQLYADISGRCAIEAAHSKIVYKRRFVHTTHSRNMTVLYCIVSECLVKPTL